MQDHFSQIVKDSIIQQVKLSSVRLELLLHMPYIISSSGTFNPVPGLKAFLLIKKKYRQHFMYDLYLR